MEGQNIRSASADLLLCLKINCILPSPLRAFRSNQQARLVQQEMSGFWFGRNGDGVSVQGDGFVREEGLLRQ